MHVRASEIKDLSRVMDLINQAKEYFNAKFMKNVATRSLNLT